MNEESLHPIFLNLRLNDTILIDRFEWDLSCPSNQPEEFARVLCEDLGLNGEFEAQIALAIREQLRDYSRLIREGLKDRVTRLPAVSSPWRDRSELPMWEPVVKYVLAEDVAPLEREDFKRMRPYSQSAAPIPLQPVPKQNKPPKPVNTFLMFCRQWRKKIMTENANTSAKDASRILGEMWQKLSEEERASYQPLTDQENERRMREWRIKENLEEAKSVPAAVVLTSVGTGSVETVSTADDHDNDNDNDNDQEEDEDAEEAVEDEDENRDTDEGEGDADVETDEGDVEPSAFTA